MVAINAVNAKDYTKINIIYQDGGKWLMFNLGVINDWIIFKNIERETPQKVKIESENDIQRSLLFSLEVLMTTDGNTMEYL